MPRPFQSIDDVLTRLVRDEATDCLVWTGCIWRGYGQVSFGGHPQAVHRVVYEQLVGPIPEGMHIDHLCRRRECANVDHLECVTPRENMLRMWDARGRRECDHGSDDIYVTSAGYRLCRPCAAAYRREYRSRSRDAERAPLGSARS